MIVQVTNTGFDLSEGGHFDLMMPGGGIGAMNGCRNQWGADGSWGDQYGGLHTVQGCENLPEQLRPGCYWRFGWFENAANPDVEYVRATCPIELTDISRSRRSDEDGEPISIIGTSGGHMSEDDESGGANTRTTASPHETTTTTTAAPAPVLNGATRDGSTPAILNKTGILFYCAVLFLFRQWVL